MKMKMIGATVCALSLLTGCTPDLGHADYDISQVGQAGITRRGVVVARREIKIHRRQKAAVNEGLVTGAAAGGLGGAAIGYGTGHSGLAGAAIGGLAGAGIGYLIDEKTRTSVGFEYQVKLDDGIEITISQGPPAINVGQRVIFVESTGTGRGRGAGRDRIVPE